MVAKEEKGGRRKEREERESKQFFVLHRGGAEKNRKERAPYSSFCSDLLAATPSAILIHAASVIFQFCAKLQRRRKEERVSKQVFCSRPRRSIKTIDQKRKEEHRT